MTRYRVTYAVDRRGLKGVIFTDTFAENGVLCPEKWCLDRFKQDSAHSKRRVVSVEKLG
jgi:hypothetical protein